MSFEEYLHSMKRMFDTQLERRVPRVATEAFIRGLTGGTPYAHDTKAITRAILEPTWYLLGLGGKRWRPALMLLIIEALGRDPMRYVEFSLLPEIVHNATLAADDLEDRSLTRRGAPSLHVKYGIDIAVNLSPYLYFFPIVALMRSRKLNERSRRRLLYTYMEEMLRVHAGQATDIAWHNSLVSIGSISEGKYLQMAYDKTGVLSRMACKMGAILCDAPDKDVDALGDLGASIGVAFQIQDDILNITPSKLSESKGGVGDDVTEGKVTLLVIYTLRRASKRDRQRLLSILKMHTRNKALIREAISIIDKYGAKEYAKRRMAELANNAWERANRLLKDSPAKRRIGELVEFLINRAV